MKNNEKSFNEYLASISQENMRELILLREQHANRVMATHEKNKQFLSNLYLHELTSLVNQFYNESSESLETISFDKEPFYNTIIASPYNDLYLGERLAGHYHNAEYEILYGIISNTELVVGVQAENFSDYVMLYSIRFPKDFDFEIIAWHKDFLLDLAAKRPHHNLDHFKIKNNKKSDNFKLYTNNVNSVTTLLNEDFFEKIEAISNLNGKKPVDFSVMNKQISIIVHSIHHPFGLPTPTEKSDLTHVHKDLEILNKHSEIVREMINLVDTDLSRKQ